MSYLTEAAELEPLPALPIDSPARTALANLHAAILAIDTERAAMTAAGDWTNLAYGLAQLRALGRALSIATSAVEGDLATVMPGKRMEVEGLGVIERRSSRSRSKWDWDQLLPRLVRLSIDPEGTGAIPEGAVLIEAMRALITDTIGVTPSRGPRVTALRNLGLDPDEWCESTPNRPSVQMTGSVD